MNRKARRAAGDFKPQQEAKAAHYDISGGLHSAEIRIINRALRAHLQEATAHKAQLVAVEKAGGDVKRFELQQAQDAIDAICAVVSRLLKQATLHQCTNPHCPTCGK